MLYFNMFLYYLIVIGCPIIFTLSATCELEDDTEYKKDDYRMLAAKGTKYAL
jgi:hypothetical protein